VPARGLENAILDEKVALPGLVPNTVGSPSVLLSPSSRPHPTVVLVLPVEPESSVIVVGFCVVRRYRVVVAIMLPCRAGPGC
jgi:hypothetical protein